MWGSAWKQYYDSLTTSVSLNYSAVAVTSNLFSAGLYAHFAGPSITSVTGCTSSSSAVSVVGCTVGATITLTGSFIDGTSVQGSVWQCQNVNISSWTTLTCTIGTPYGSFTPGQPIAGYAVARLNNSLITSGSFYITLASTPSEPSNSSSSSSSRRAVDIAVPIVVVLVVAAVAVGSLCVWRKKVVKRRSQPDSGSDSSSWLSANHSPSDAASHTELGSYGRSTV